MGWRNLINLKSIAVDRHFSLCKVFYSCIRGIKINIAGNPERKEEAYLPLRLYALHPSVRICVICEQPNYQPCHADPVEA